MRGCVRLDERFGDVLCKKLGKMFDADILQVYFGQAFSNNKKILEPQLEMIKFSILCCYFITSIPSTLIVVQYAREKGFSL